MEISRCTILFLLIVSLFCLISAKIVNKNVDLSLDISSQLVKEHIRITATNSDGKPISVYTFLVPATDRKNLAFISAKDENKKDLKFTENLVNGHHEFSIAFPTSLATEVFTIETVYTKKLIPHPSQIPQSGKQLVKYEGNLYLYSPYETTSHKTSVLLSSANLLSHTQVKPFNVAANKIKYGPYENIAALTNQSLVIHYENERPFLTTTRLERIIEVSHWGNIAVKENIFMEHTGALLKGSFSRYEFQKDGRSGNAIKSYKTLLPASASDVYYRDTNGNISTSNMKILRDSVELELRPRFPLFGGWKTQYTLGYNIPSFEYLFNADDKYQLRMRLIDHIYNDMVIDEAEVKIILPEGVSNIEITTPYSVKRGANELHFTYLDTVGRPVITLYRRNLVENHIANFSLKYTFSKISLLQEPLLVVAFFFIIFIVAIISLRLDFSINTSHSHKD
ncbi:PREDICTED: dolichyl-diphosphooligosaccharide--protein glycosyltransferase subunit 1 [Rhagoletis zephyria]|uniref:dolichyl-diphosphooligosaccharide--protein glycosyltransferase subunit 1 n=1 Tax=Rhagoletis zephyria TaxID=28612 RepID=UPI0008114264|nr:PREDICTED: dolichyl-diphosphooligosaccharide--protein glycosyltransferase subunit 1 [Rhagoletis zephyria]